MFKISIVFLYIDSDFPLSPLISRFLSPSHIGFLKNWFYMFVDLIRAFTAKKHIIMIKNKAKKHVIMDRYWKEGRYK